MRFLKKLVILSLTNGKTVLILYLGLKKLVIISKLIQEEDDVRR